MTSQLQGLQASELIRAVRLEPAIIAGIKETQESGRAALNWAERQASLHYRDAQIQYTEAILWLHVIREYELWSFGGYKNWTHFIEAWIDQSGRGTKGRTMVLESLKAVRLWMGPTINRPPEEIIQFEEGVSSIEPLFDPETGVVQRYNNRTGEIESLKDEWERKLPGRTIEDKIGGFIEQIPHESTRTETRDRIDDEIPKPKMEFFPLWGDGVCVGVAWRLWDKEGNLHTKGSNSLDELFSGCRELDMENELMNLFRFPRERRQ